MLLAAQIVAVVLVALAIGQAVLAGGFVLRLRRPYPELLDDGRCPKAAVVLCLRGADPSLPECLRAIARQDYPDYEVRVVVDCESDPAWAIAEEVAPGEQRNLLRLEPLTDRRSTCSLKCSALVQTIGRLDDSFQFVALVDADTIAHPTWLRELATALNDPEVGAATGNRWYLPPDFAVGSLVRYLWNAAAIVQMYSYGIAWGGTLAMRLADVRRVGWLDRIGQAFCEDTMLRTLLNRHGLRVQFVPSLLMTNRERCDLGGFYQWVTRQLLTARLYHAYWPLVVNHGVTTTIGVGAGLAFLLVAVFMGQAAAAGWLGLGLAIYYGFMIGLLMLLEAAVRACLRARGESPHWITPGAVLMMLPSIFVTQVVYAAALIRAVLLRKVAWRGATYDIRGPWQVRLLHDQPFLQEAPAATQPRVSL